MSMTVMSIDQCIANNSRQSYSKLQSKSSNIQCAMADTFVKKEVNDSKLNKITESFCETEPKNLPKKIIEAIKWGSDPLSACAAAEIVCNSSKPELDPDVFNSVKALLNPNT